MPIVAAVVAIIAWLKALTPVVKIPLKIGFLVAALALIPVPEWASSIPTKIAGMPETVQYMLYMSQLGFGLVAVGSAYTLSTAWGIFSGAVKGS